MNEGNKKIFTVIMILLMLLLSSPLIASAVAMKGGMSDNEKGHGQGIGVARHPDTAKDAEGRMHMVWQEPVDGQYEIFYAVSGGDSNEFGIGADANPTIQLSDSTRDSHNPKISIDPSTGIIYVIWTEDIPMEVLDAEGGSFIERSLLYRAVTATESTSVETWTREQNLATGDEPVKQFAVLNGEYEIRGSTVLKGIMDTDRDSLTDYVEALGIKGYITKWFDPDSDDDGMRDDLEYVYGFNPVLNEILSPYAKEFFRVIWLLADDDDDGLTYAEESACNFPVTARVASMLNTGTVEYIFFPEADYTASLVLDLQIKHLGLLSIPPAVTTNYTLTVTINAGESGTQEFSYTGSALEWDRFQVNIGSFNVYMDAETSISIYVSMPLPQKGEYRLMAISSVMITAASPSHHLFSYKEGGDFNAAGSSLVGVITEDFEICGDPLRPDLFLEVDYFEGHEQPGEVYSEAINAFSDAGIKLHYRIDQEDLSLDMTTNPDPDDDGAETLRNEDEQGYVLDETRNSAYDDYIHIVFGHTLVDDDLPGWTLYGGAMSASTAGDLTHSGILMADQALIDITSGWSTLLERRIKVLVHEVGHTLGASHEKSTGSFNAIIDGPGTSDTENNYNVMRQDALDNSKADKLLRGIDNTDRRFGASEDIGRPRFSIESVAQFDLTAKLSVDTGRNIDILDQYV